MNSPIIISNARQFRRFLAVRRTVLALFLLGVILVFTDLAAWKYVAAYQLFSLAGLGILGLYEWLYKPAFLEIQQSPSGLRGLSIYNPEQSFFHRFRAGEVQPLVIRPGDQLILHKVAGVIPRLDKVRFTLCRSGEQDITTKPLGIGWATAAERAALEMVVDSFYSNPRLGSGGGVEIPFGEVRKI
jgi:hypothetical protein